MGSAWKGGHRYRWGVGIGTGVSEVLAAAGAKVAVADINPSTAAATIKRITDAGHQAKIFEHDVTSWKSSFTLVEKVEKEFGPIDILVNNAGVTNGSRSSKSPKPIGTGSRHQS